MDAPLLLMGYDPGPEGRALAAAEIGDVAEILHLPDLADRAGALRRATVLLARNTAQELLPGEAALLRGARLVQFLTAGLDYIPLRDLPAEVPIANNAGGYAEPMAEHALAMVLAAAKRLMEEHAALARGEFHQFRMNRMLAGGVCGILGYGGIGAACAKLFRALGMRIHAVRRRATPGPGLDWIGTPDRLDELLAAADVLIVSVPLTGATRGMLGARELGLMKRDAILVNLARGEILEEAALFAHLRAHPDFTACLDAWWVEPVRHGAFRMDHPFMTLPNVIGSPHNSGSVHGWREESLRRALANCRRALAGETPWHLIGAEERASAPEG
jgi:phosphoglycerate dehydrogenase-like enzyme